ncbi:hypothetical protein [Streptomyces collinus]|uniref:hypothetical protein n=1 Tax=Streptomyces collinus TaxID=42684 RepID=UPI003329DBD9
MPPASSPRPAAAIAAGGGHHLYRPHRPRPGREVLQDPRSGSATGAHAAAQSLRDLWDADQSALQPLDNTGWTFLDTQMDQALKPFGIDHSNPPMSPARQESELKTLLADMR